jgi:hypothetical protein
MSLTPAAHAQRGTAAFNRVFVESEVIKGAPYSAEIVNESVQMLSDGNRIVHRSTSRVYRDSEGRTRREEDRASGSAAITITDPVTGSSWSLDVDTHEARQGPVLPRLFEGTLGLYRARSELDRLTIVVNGQMNQFNVVRPPDGTSAEQRAEDHLAARTIEGLRVEGIRRTTTIPAGAIGNERPIVVTSDEWTSPELKVLVLSESNDPRTGTSTYKLVNVKRGDPPSSLFQVPADYTVVQAPGRGEGRGEGRGTRGGAPR